MDRETLALADFDVDALAVPDADAVGEADPVRVVDPDTVALDEGEPVTLVVTEVEDEITAHPCGPAQCTQPPSRLLALKISKVPAGHTYRPSNVQYCAVGGQAAPKAP